MIRALVLVALAMTAGGCVFVPLDAQLVPIAPLPQSTVGAGTVVNFRFIDERDRPMLGKRTASSGLGTEASVRAADLPAFMEQTLRDGLTAKGYELATGQAASVTFHLRAFQYRVGQVDESGNETVLALLRVDGVRGDKSYTNVYRFYSAEQVMFNSGNNAINARINAALSSVLQQALSDQKLDQVLTGK